jgi:predicted permease
MELFLKDLKHALRAFINTPGFTITAIAAITLGIGANTAIFSVVNAVLLRPIRAPEPNRVVSFLSTSKEGSSPLASEIKFNLWRAQSDVFQDVAGYYPGFVNLTGVEKPRRASAAYVTKDYFHLFGLPLGRGRLFSGQEEESNKGSVVILSHPFWQRAFGGRPEIVGKTISLNGSRYQVIGIMATASQPELNDPPDVWFPFPIDSNSTFQAHYFRAVGRLKPGVTLQAANARLQFTTQEFRRRFPHSISTRRGDAFSVEPLQDVLAKDVRPSLLILASAVSLVLLIACANVASLLLVRATARRREVAVRLAVGASKTRIVRQLLTESTLLSAVGGVFGLGLGILGIRLLLASNPSNIPRLGIEGQNVTLDWRVLAFAVAVSLITGLVFGLAPALQSSSTTLNASLKESAGRTGTGFRHQRMRSLLVVSEMSLALLLLIGAGLLIRTLIALRSVHPGFDPRHVVTTETTLDPETARMPGAQQITQKVFREIGALPGVESAAYTRLLPLGGGFDSIPVIVVGRPLTGPSHGESRWMIVSPGYFDVLRIPLARGRSFTRADDLGAPGVAIVNQTMARQFWRGRDPVGERIVIGQGLGPNFSEPARQIVGVVADVHDNALGEAPQPAVFVPGAQLPDKRTNGRAVTWLIRTRDDSAALNAAILSLLQRATGEPVPPLRPMEEIVRQSTARQDFNMLLMNIFAGSALLLAMLGIYGLMAYTVEQRTQEMGVRMALGARATDLQLMVVRQGMRLAIGGIVIGTACAFGLTRYLEGFLFGVKAIDPIVFGFVPILFSAVALIAVWLPARRASSIDPIAALRCE